LGNEWNYIKECLDTGWVSSVGSFVDRFEEEVADYLGVEHAVAVVNGTAALHTALLVAGIQPEDEVLVSTLSFIASGNAIRYAGAWPVFIDAEPDYWQMDPEKVFDFLENECQWQNGRLTNKSTKRNISAIMPVHILGHPVDMDSILDVAEKYNLVVIEDAAEAMGTRYKDRMAGSLGDIACLSFNGNKIITSGGGGMIVTRNEEWAARTRHLSTQAKSDPVEYVHDEVGYNYRLTNLQAAMGCAQLEKLPEYVAAKRRIGETYNKAFEDMPGLHPMPEADWAHSTCWMYTVLVDQEQFGMDSRVLLAALADEQIMTRPLWQPMNLSPVFKDSTSSPCEVSEHLYEQCLSLPCSVGLSAWDQERVIRTIQNLAER
jgi:perosamine synthetase